MEILKQGNTININGKQVCFENTVDTLIKFPQCFVVLLMDNHIPDNNVVGINYKGDIIWNISQLIKLPYPEAYISLGKESETSFSVVSYSGVKFVVDTRTQEIISKSITK